MTTQQIESTTAFKQLDDFAKKLAIKSSNRKVLEQAVIHYNNHNVLLSNVGASNFKILKEFLNVK